MKAKGTQRAPLDVAKVKEEAMLQQIAKLAGWINKQQLINANQPVTPTFKNNQPKSNSLQQPSNKTSISQVRSSNNPPPTTYPSRPAKVIKKKKKIQKLYCSIFINTGDCPNRNCTFIHDKSKIKMCSKFLKGECTNPNCRYQHKIIKDQMPVCLYFLRGICNNEKCPYPHVNVNTNAAVCQEFLKGYCPDGTNCKLKHTHECQEYYKNGFCPNQKNGKCVLQHTPLKIGKDKKYSEKIVQHEQPNNDTSVLHSELFPKFNFSFSTEQEPESCPDESTSFSDPEDEGEIEIENENANQNSFIELDSVEGNDTLSPPLSNKDKSTLSSTLRPHF